MAIYKVIVKDNDLPKLIEAFNKAKKEARLHYEQDEETKFGTVFYVSVSDRDAGAFEQNARDSGLMKTILRQRADGTFIVPGY